MKSISAVKVLAVLVPLLLVGCDPDPKALIRDGQTALGSGDTQLAQTKFNEALKDLTPGGQQYVDAKLGLLVAMIPTNPRKAAAEVLLLADDYPRMVRETDFAYVVGQMVSARKFTEALDLVQTGTQRAGGESRKLMQQVERIKKAAATDSDAANALDTLGYT